MGKFLDLNGLQVVWARIKEYVGSSIKSSVSDRLGAANGIATLGADGKLTGTQLPGLKTVNGQSVVGSGDITIDLSLYKVVSALPATGDVSKIYLVAKAGAPEGDVYTEYAWINGAWEKLGEYKAEVNLSPYLTKNEAINKYLRPSVGFEQAEVRIGYIGTGDDQDSGDDEEITIGEATTSSAGVMSVEHVQRLNSLEDNCFVGLGDLESIAQEDAVKIEVTYQEKISGDIGNSKVSGNIPAATASAAGVMSRAMFSKLNSIAANATADSGLTTTEIESVLK